MMIYALRDISDGEELSIDYGFTSQELEIQYGFRCDCGNCDGVVTPDGGLCVGGLSEGSGMELTPHIKESSINRSNSAAEAEMIATEILNTVTELQNPIHPSRPQNRPSPESPLNSLLRATFTHTPSTFPPPRCRPETLSTLLAIRPSFLNSQPRGLGVLALHDLSPGRLLLDEAPLFAYPSYALFAQVLHLLSKLEPEEMSITNDLCSRQRPSVPELEIDELLRANAFLRLNGKCKEIFEVACSINHACENNANYNWVWGHRMLVRAKQTILKGEEVTISYVEEDGEVKDNYGFVCQCGPGCVDGKDGEY